MLFYESLQQAEEALGRNLTVAETLWFKYSADKPDYILHFHNIVFLFCFYTLLPLPYVFMELFLSERMDKFKIQKHSNKQSFWDMLRCYKYVVKTFLLAVGPIQIFSYPVIKWVGIHTSLELPSKWEVFWQIVVYFLVEDYANYWVHRMLHTEWAYDKIHRVHHEFTAPNGLAAPYAHWAEILVVGIPSFLGPLLVPCHILTLWLWFILRQMEAMETHTGYDFSWSPTKYIPYYGGARYHDFHHYVGGKSRSNFASVFTYCDYIYDTHNGYQYYTSILKKNSNKKEKEK